jgi:biotin transport system substrate-specific component
MSSSAEHATGLLRKAIDRPWPLQAGLAVAGVGLLAASAWLSIPFYPVPLTMQTLAVLLLGAVLGPRLGVASVLGYLALGVSGAPVFHGGLGGPAVIAGPTGGYLLGFVPAVFVMGWAAQRTRTSSRGWRAKVQDLGMLAIGALLAEASIYAVGIPWLAAVYTGGDLGRAATVGAVPYLLGDALKAAVAVAAARVAGRRRRP